MNINSAHIILNHMKYLIYHRCSMHQEWARAVLLVLSVCDGEIILEKGEILCEKCQ